MHILKLHTGPDLYPFDNLLTRTETVCKLHDINFLKLVCDPVYATHIRKSIKCDMYYKNDGISDSVRQLLLSQDSYDKTVLNLLLTPHMSSQ